MDESLEPGPARRYLWPWFALAGVIVAMLLAFVWMTVAVQKTRRARTAQDPLATASPTNLAPSTNRTPATTSTNSAPDSLLTGGNAEAGRRIFFEKPEANCAKCHRVGGLGGETGPALDGIGAARTRQQLLDAMLQPNAQVVEGYDSVVLLLNNGMGCSGFLKGETESELAVLTPEDGLMTIRKSEIQIRQKGLSPMPEGLDQILSAQDLRDLVEYMATLKE
jgi:putative heme-binding domain-containing protein